MEGWQLVYVSDQPHRIEIAKAVLSDSGIRTVEMNRKDSLYLTIGVIELYVADDVAALAKIIIEQNQL